MPRKKKPSSFVEDLKGTTKVGVPKVEVKHKQVYQMAMYGMNNREISILLDIDEHTLSRHFERFLTKGRERIRMKLRRKQQSLALQGDRTMLIWLGKQMLGQKEPEKQMPDTVVVQQNQGVDLSALTSKELTRLIREERKNDITTQLVESDRQPARISHQDGGKAGRTVEEDGSDD